MGDCNFRFRENSCGVKSGVAFLRHHGQRVPIFFSRSCMTAQCHGKPCHVCCGAFHLCDRVTYCTRRNGTAHFLVMHRGPPTSFSIVATECSSCGILARYSGCHTSIGELHIIGTLSVPAPFWAVFISCADKRALIFPCGQV